MSVGTAKGAARSGGPRRVRPWLAALSSLLVAAAVVAVSLDVTGRLPGRPAADPATTAPAVAGPLDPRPVDAPDVLEPEPAAGAVAVPAVPVEALDAVLASGPLGPAPGAVVLDVAGSTSLLDRSGAVPRTPASVAKLVTGAGALATLDPRSRLRTTVVHGAVPGELVLVGAGDTTLTAGRSPLGGYPRRASLVDLAAATAAAVRATGSTEVVLRVDDSLFSGPATSPGWPSTYVGSGVVSPVSALSVDAGRVSATSDARSRDPALAAGRSLAGLLDRRGVTVTGPVTRSAAPAGAAEVAAVASPTVAELVELMLGSSDNDLAESMLRLVAVGAGRPGTFAEGSAAVTRVLDDLAVPTGGLVLLDGSGLARGSAIAPETLARLLVTAADGSRPVLGHLVGGLPVAGFSGTLSLRFGAGRAGTAAGLVRAKTGTLTGVGTLAGVGSAGGRPVVFVVMSDVVRGDPAAARDALDRFAATLVGAPAIVVGPGD